MPVTRADIAAWVVSALALGLVITLHLLPALLAGLLVFELVNVLTPLLRVRGLGRDGPRLPAVTLIATVVVAALAAARRVARPRAGGRRFGAADTGRMAAFALGLPAARRPRSWAHAGSCPLSERMARQADRLASAFRRVVFAQVWISSINTFVTWLYLGVALPGFGVEELLVAMLVMEAAFGIPGLIAAPIFHAYFKEELHDKGLV